MRDKNVAAIDRILDFLILQSWLRAPQVMMDIVPSQYSSGEFSLKCWYTELTLQLDTNEAHAVRKDLTRCSKTDTWRLLSRGRSTWC